MRSCARFAWPGVAILGALAISSCGGGGAITVSGTTIARYACAPVSAAMESAAGSGATVTVTVPSTATAYGSAADCAAKTSGTEFTIPEGATTATVYVYTTNLGTFPLTLNVNGTETAVDVTVQDMSVLGALSPERSDDTLLGLEEPHSAFSDGTRLFLADSVGNRVLIWNAAPTSPDDPPSLVLGQDNFEDLNSNSSAVDDAGKINGPRGVFFDGTKLYVADSGNHRVLIWNTLPTENGQNADVVVGQPNFATFSAGSTASKLDNPQSVYAAGGKLYVADQNNNRVLGFSPIPTAANATATFALGQPDTTSNAQNNGGIGNDTLADPAFVIGDGTHLAVADTTNNRVLLWNTLPAANGAAANVVVGQANFGNAGDALTATGLASPSAAAFDGANLWIADAGNGRVLRYSGVPTTNGATAVGVLGKPDFVSRRRSVSATNLAIPTGIAFAGDSLWVSDSDTHRVNRFAKTATNGAAADACYGQRSCETSNTHEGGSQRTHFSYPEDSHVDLENNRLYVADSSNNRVLVYAPIPTKNLAAPDFVLGQTDFFATGNGATRTTMNYPVGIATAGKKLIVSDTGNHRLLVWNTPPTTNAAPADVVVGQADFTSNGDALSATGLYSPWGLASNGTNLVAADYRNERVLIWNTVPTTNGTAADLVLGQPDFTTNTAMNATLAEGGRLDRPFSVAIDGTKLFVGDYYSNRVLGWNAMPTTNGQTADFVVGQPDFSTLSGGTTASKITGPYGLYAAFGRLFVPSYDDARVIGFVPLPSTTGATATLLYGQTTFTSTSGGATFADKFTDIASGSADARRVWINDSGNNRIRIYAIE